MPNNKLDSGILSKTKQKRTPNSPDYYSYIDLSDEVVQQLLQAKKAGQPAVLQLSGWVKKNEMGTFISLAASVKEEQQQQRGGFNKQPSQKGRNVPQNRDPFSDDEEDPFGDDIPF